MSNFIIPMQSRLFKSAIKLDREDSEQRSRVLAFNFALFCCAPVYFIVYLAIGAPMSAGIVALAGVLIFCNVLLLLSGLPEKTCGQFLTGIGWCTYTSLACIAGGHNSPPEIWHTTIPVFAIVLTGVRSGVL